MGISASKRKGKNNTETQKSKGPSNSKSQASQPQEPKKEQGQEPEAELELSTKPNPNSPEKKKGDKRNVPFSSKDDEISKPSELEKKIKSFTRTTFLVFVVGMAVIVVGSLMVIISVVLFVRAGQLAPQVLEAPSTRLDQGLLLFSPNQVYFASFASDLGVYKQGVKPTSPDTVGQLLWQTAKVIPLNSTLSFNGNGVLTIESAQERLIWSNESQLNTPRPPEPYELVVSDEGALTIRSQLNGGVLWQRPEAGAFEPIPAARPGGSQIYPDEYIYSENELYYTRFLSQTGRLYLYSSVSGTLIWTSPEPSPPPTDTSSYRCNLTVLGNLEITDAQSRVGWSTQTANFTRNTLYFYQVTNTGRVAVWSRFWGEAARMLWSSSEEEGESFPKYSLSTGERLNAATPQQQQLVSPNLQYWVRLTSNGEFQLGTGNFVLNSTGAVGPTVWMSDTTGEMVQQDANGQVVWSNHTPAISSSWPLVFTLSDEGKLVWSNNLGSILTIFASLDQV